MVVLDTRFFLCVLSFALAGGFSPDIHLSYPLKAIAKNGFYSAVFFYVAYTLLSFLPMRAREWSKNILLVLSLASAFLRFFMGYYFNMDINQALMETLQDTNVHESLAFLKAHVLPHSALFLALLAFCALFLYFVRFKWELSRRVHLILLVFMSLGVGAHMGRTAYLFAQRGMAGWSPPEVWETLPLIKEARALYFSLRYSTQVARQSLDRPFAKDYLRVDKESVPYVVLIVGESVSRNFMGVYGYALPNTPFLSSLKNRERERSQNLFVFEDAISAFANTSPVLQTLLNYSDVENRHTPWYFQRSLGDIFKLAGYQTFWLTNQDPAQANNAYKLLPKRFESFYRTSSLDTSDQALLDLFEQKVKPQLGAKNAIVFHLIGSHILYHERFPKSFAKFSPAQIPTQGLHIKNKAQLQTLADYVNSIYYTDSVLRQIFKLFEKKDALILYLSDHAQDMFESGSTYGHRCSIYGVQIPFIIYVTDLFKQKHPSKVQQLAQAVHKPFMSDDLIHTLLPLVGIHTKDHLESKNLLSPKFDEKRQRIYCDDKVYPHP
ncbi:phosphoethanolamine transferase [Helicobacter felis]|uniref:phosphoethanolamine transferase n=1 Tax=Helicobacter felis TaxID=214 RepID=UPI001F2BF0E6|nr:phosphoethanolamine transferase [Helicobacter felis]